jgi:uncharacterized repeat protein (TIGR04042 family)
MPEMRFEIRWPDESASSCYSPSLVIKEYLSVGQSYPLAEFMTRCREALAIASERVKQKYGMHCTGALAQLAELEDIARRFKTDPQAKVTILGFKE